MFLCEVDWVVSWDAFAGVRCFLRGITITRPAATLFREEGLSGKASPFSNPDYWLQSQPSSALRAPSSQRRHDRSIIRPAGTFFPKKA